MSKLTKESREALPDARDWLREHADYDSDIVQFLSNDEIIGDLHKRYPGGWDAFLTRELELTGAELTAEHTGAAWCDECKSRGRHRLTCPLRDREVVIGAYASEVAAAGTRSPYGPGVEGPDGSWRPFYGDPLVSDEERGR